MGGGEGRLVGGGIREVKGVWGRDTGMVRDR